jgi:ferredoxin
LSCAYELVRKGYPVTVFESAPEAGGMLRYGIPEYRLPRNVLDDEVGYIKELGVEIQPLAQDVKWHEDRCTHCTACISICPPKALDVDRKTMEVSFNRDKCIACELCIPVCPYQAMEILF